MTSPEQPTVAPSTLLYLFGGEVVKRVKPDCERIATLRPAFEAASERWMTFRRADPELDRALFDAIALGLAERIPKKGPIDYDPLSWYP